MARSKRSVRLKNENRSDVQARLQSSERVMDQGEMGRQSQWERRAKDKSGH